MPGSSPGMTIFVLGDLRPPQPPRQREQEHRRRPQDQQVGDQRRDHREGAEPAEQSAATAGRRTPSRRARRRAPPRSGSRRGRPARSPARPRRRDPRRARSSSRRRLRKWIVALRPRPNETISATTLANCRPSPISQSTRAGEHDREDARQDARQHHDERAEGEADEGGDEDDLDRQRPVELADHVGAVARRDRREAGDGRSCSPDASRARRRAPCRAARSPAAAGSRRCPGMRPETTTASCSAEMKRRVRCSGRMSTYCFSVATSVLAGLLGEPAPQRLQRPDVADAGLLLDDRMHVGDGGERLGRVERGALRELDQHVDRIGAGELGVEPARSPRPPARGRAPGRRAGSAARALA